MKGVDNIFTQHVPLMKELVEDLIKSRLKEEQYPFLSDINQPTKKYEYSFNLSLQFILLTI